MEVTKTHDGDRLSVALTGRLDTTTAPPFQEEMVPELQGVKTLDMDFSGLEYISSAGLRALLFLHKQCVKDGCTMTIRGCNDVTSDVFRMTGFDKVLNLE